MQKHDSSSCENYPMWLLQSIQYDLARTVVVHLSGDHDQTMQSAVHAVFCKEFGEQSVETCQGGDEHYQGIFYVRLWDSSSKNGEVMAACNCAYEAVESLDQVSPPRSESLHAHALYGATVRKCRPGTGSH